MTKEDKIVKERGRGRPKIYESREALQEAIDKYFDSRYENIYIKDKEGNIIETKRELTKPLTIMGLCVALGLERQTLLNYSKDDLYFDIIKQARQVVQTYVEERLLNSSNQTGAIFWLKNNAGYHDKQEIDSNVTTNVSLSDLYAQSMKDTLPVREVEVITEKPPEGSSDDD